MNQLKMLITYQLNSIQSCLDHAISDLHREWNKIEKNNKRGKYRDYEDYESAQDLPIARLEIALRAVGYELVALVENYFHKFAHKGWRDSKKYKGPKSILDLEQINSSTLSRIIMVSDVSFGEVIKIIEEEYCMKLSEIEGWEDVKQLRQTVNAFKHRDGFKHPREIDWTKGDKLHPRDAFWVEEAKDAIGKTKLFLIRFLTLIDGKIKKPPQ